MTVDAELDSGADVGAEAESAGGTATRAGDRARLCGSWGSVTTVRARHGPWPQRWRTTGPTASSSRGRRTPMASSSGRAGGWSRRWPCSPGTTPIPRRPPSGRWPSSPPSGRRCPGRWRTGRRPISWICRRPRSWPRGRPSGSGPGRRPRPGPRWRPRGPSTIRPARKTRAARAARRGRTARRIVGQRPQTPRTPRTPRPGARPSRCGPTRSPSWRAWPATRTRRPGGRTSSSCVWRATPSTH